MGAISLCECIFDVLDKNSFEEIFTQITNVLRVAAEIQINGFTQDFNTMLNFTSTKADNTADFCLDSYLDVLHEWACMFGRLIERFEKRKFANFNVLLRSEDLSSVMFKLISLTAKQTTTFQDNSLISFSGIQKIDEQLN